MTHQRQGSTHKTRRTREKSKTLADRPVGELISAVASDAVSPGAGAAGAVALALAAACAGKAAAVTLKHHPDDEALVRAHARLGEIGRRALGGADEDASRFADFARTKSKSAAEKLVQAGENLHQLAESLHSVLFEIQARIDPVVAGDITAARKLCEACLTIQAANLAENRDTVQRAPH